MASSYEVQQALLMYGAIEGNEYVYQKSLTKFFDTHISELNDVVSSVRATLSKLADNNRVYKYVGTEPAQITIGSRSYTYMYLKRFDDVENVTGTVHTSPRLLTLTEDALYPLKADNVDSFLKTSAAKKARERLMRERRGDRQRDFVPLGDGGGRIGVGGLSGTMGLDYAFDVSRMEPHQLEKAKEKFPMMNVDSNKDREGPVTIS